MNYSAPTTNKEKIKNPINALASVIIFPKFVFG